MAGDVLAFAEAGEEADVLAGVDEDRRAGREAGRGVEEEESLGLAAGRPVLEEVVGEAAVAFGPEASGGVEGVGLASG